MTNNKQQTAVQLIIQALDIECKSRGMNVNWDMYLEKEREQIAKAFDDGDYNYHYSRKTGDDFEDGKEYYQEVYGKEI